MNILVESNDRLYIGDDEFRSELADYCSQLLTELLNDLHQLGNEHQYRKQVQPIKAHLAYFSLYSFFFSHMFRLVFVWICSRC